MKSALLPLVGSLSLVLGCASGVVPSQAGLANLYSEEIFTRDSSSPDFAPSSKKIYRYDRNKLVEVVVYEYDSVSHVYDSGFVAEEFHYANGKLSQRIHYLGSAGIRWIEDYEYLDETSTKVTRYESGTTGLLGLKDWWLIEKTPVSLKVKYYQLDDQLYAQLNYDVDEKGNVVSVTGNPAFPVGSLYYRYDDSPNPHQFPELSGEYGLDSQQYISENNAVEETSDSSGSKLVRAIEYEGGLPVTITTATSKRVFTYQ